MFQSAYRYQTSADPIVILLLPRRNGKDAPTITTEDENIISHNGVYNPVRGELVEGLRANGNRFIFVAMTGLNNLLLLVLIVLYADGEFRANYLAKATAQALVFICYFRERIALGTQFVARRQRISGAELYAVSTALASVFVDYHLWGFSGLFRVVKGFSP
jgi:hypothetical protein